MFSNLRQGSQLYILHKSASTPFIEMGSVESTSNMMMGYYPSMPSMPINISVRTGEKVTPYQNLPPNSAAADVTNNATGETITIACTKDALNNELQSLRQKSFDAINSVEYHRQRISAYDGLINQLNPEVAEKAAQAQEISALKSQVSDLTASVSELLAQLKGEGTSSKKGETK